MFRDNILQLINRYAETYPGESDVVSRIRDFVQANEHCFARELKVGHITGSAWILDASHSKVLLTHHKKLNIWVQLGGHADGDPDVSQVAMREAEEESGLSNIKFLSNDLFDIDIHLIPERADEPAHYHYDCRFLLEATDEDYIVSEESHDLAWIVLTEIKSLTQEESLLRMVRKTPR